MKNSHDTNSNQKYVSKMGVWSSGMILASGARGREFDSRNTPQFTLWSPFLLLSIMLLQFLFFLYIHPCSWHGSSRPAFSSENDSLGFDAAKHKLQFLFKRQLRQKSAQDATHTHREREIRLP
jgi:hypothetical protein